MSSNRPDWNSWILEKNNAAQEDTLKKSDSVVIESLEKAKTSFVTKLPSGDTLHHDSHEYTGGGYYNHNYHTKDPSGKVTSKHTIDSQPGLSTQRGGYGKDKHINDAIDQHIDHAVHNDKLPIPDDDDVEKASSSPLKVGQKSMVPNSDIHVTYLGDRKKEGNHTYSVTDGEGKSAGLIHNAGTEDQGGSFDHKDDKQYNAVHDHISSLHGPLEKARSGIFNVDHTHEVNAMNHEAGKKRAHEIIDNSPARDITKAKAKNAINSTRNHKQLMLCMSNHLLMHEGMGSDPSKQKKWPGQGPANKSTDEENSLEKTYQEIVEKLESLEKARKPLPFKHGSNIAFESYHDEDGKPRKNRKIVEHTVDGEEIVHHDLKPHHLDHAMHEDTGRLRPAHSSPTDVHPDHSLYHEAHYTKVKGTEQMANGTSKPTETPRLTPYAGTKWRNPVAAAKPAEKLASSTAEEDSI